MDGSGEEVAQVPVRQSQRGINRVQWNLRYSALDQREGQPPGGPLVLPGTYTVRLEVNGQVSETSLEVREDPRLQVAPAVRARWTENLLALDELVRQAGEGLQAMRTLAQEVAENEAAPADLRAKSQDLSREWGELASRTRRLRGEAESWIGPLTQQQESQWSFYEEMLETLRMELAAFSERVGG
jgi:hypothetical protein